MLLLSCKKDIPANDSGTASYGSTSPVTTTPTIDSLKIGMIAYYAFNNSAADSSGNNNNGIATNTVSTTDRNGKANGAYYFDGITSSIEVKDNIPLRLNNTDFTINTWVRIDSYGQTYGTILLCKRGLGSANGWNYGIHGNVASNGAINGQTTFQVSSGNDPLGLGVKIINLNTWYMLTTEYSYKKQQVTFYVNGVLDDVTSNVPSPSASTSVDVYIGKDNPLLGTTGYFFKGAMDDTRIYSRILSLSDIQKLLVFTN